MTKTKTQKARAALANNLNAVTAKQQQQNQKARKQNKELVKDISKIAAVEKLGNLSIKNQSKFTKVSNQHPIFSRLNNEQKKHVTKLFLSTVDPKHHNAHLFPDEYTLEPASVANPFAAQHTVWKGVTENDQLIKSFSVVGFGQPFRGALVQYVDEQLPEHTYSSHSAKLPVGPLPTEVFYDYGVLTCANSNVTRIHGQYLYGGFSERDERVYYWLNQSDGYVVNILNPDLTLTAVLTVYKYGENVPVYSSVQTSNNSVISFSLFPTPDDQPSYGYYAFGLQISCPSATTETTVEVTLSININIHELPKPGLNIFFQHLAVADLDYERAIASSVRVYGMSMLMTNTSNVLKRGGTISLYQVPQDQDFLTYLHNSKALLSAKGVTTLKAETGGYSFWKIHSPTDIEFADTQSTNPYTTGGFNRLYFDIDTNREPLITQVNLSDTEDGRDFYLELSYAINYKTTSTWRVLEKPYIDDDVMQAYRILMSAVKQFDENPLHLEDIRKFLVNYGLPIAKGVATVLALL